MRALVSISLVVLGSLTAAVAAAHPVLQEYGLDRSPYPGAVYLVRSPRPLPEASGLSVLGRKGSTAIVAAEAAAIADLRLAGFQVTPIDPRLKIAQTAARTWRRVTTADPQVQYLVDQVAWPELVAKITWLQDFGTRFSPTPQCDAAAESLSAFFDDLGLATEFHPFTFNGWPMRNVIATQTGTTYPDSIFVICGHYDSISDEPNTNAPGADDNASGTTAVMTAAELFAPYTFEYTIKYVCFAGEEQGLVGSQAWCAWARGQNLAIVGAMNFDMIGYWRAGRDFDLEIESNDASVWLMDAITNAADLYAGMAYETHVDNGAWWGDHASFWGEGYAAINHEEAWDWYDPDFNPFYHSTRDRIAWIDSSFCVGNTRVAIASLATLARLDEGPPVGVADRDDREDREGMALGQPLLRVAPNPFNGRVALSFAGLAGRSSAEVGVYDARGQLVAIFTAPVRDGAGSAAWDARDVQGREVGSGVYFCRLRDEPRAGTVKLIYVK
jgi:hypothetical protein